jgi:hypothetical protein
MRAWVVVALIAVGGDASAQPTIDLARCRAFDEEELRKAIAAEMVEGEAVVAIECPDAITVKVRIEGTDLEKTLELGDLPGDLRARTVALAVAELVDAVEEKVDEIAKPPPPPEVRATGEGGVDAKPFAAATPAMVDVVRVEAQRPRWKVRRAIGGSETVAAHGVARAGFRVFTDDGAPMLDLAVGWARGPFVLEAFGATRSVDDELGDVRASVGGAALSVTVGCRGGDGTYLCAGVRGGVGVAVVGASAVHPMIEAHDVVAGYGEIGPKLEVRVEHRRWSGSLALVVGWAGGLVALADDREIARLAGPVVSATFGLGWAP